jgi:hypothetical protein
MGLYSGAAFPALHKFPCMWSCIAEPLAFPTYSSPVSLPILQSVPRLIFTHSGTTTCFFQLVYDIPLPSPSGFNCGYPHSGVNLQGVPNIGNSSRRFQVSARTAAWSVELSVELFIARVEASNKRCLPPRPEDNIVRTDSSSLSQPHYHCRYQRRSTKTKLRVCNRPVARAVTNTDHSSHDRLGHAVLGKPWYAYGSRQLTLTTTILIPPHSPLHPLGGFNSSPSSSGR